MLIFSHHVISILLIQIGITERKPGYAHNALLAAARWVPLRLDTLGVPTTQEALVAPAAITRCCQVERKPGQEMHQLARFRPKPRDGIRGPLAADEDIPLRDALSVA